jgi:hypothetical protein
MKITNKIEKHIEEEKQLSEYKLQLLKAGESKPYKERLIFKEEDFINFDFSKIPFSSLEEVREAILLFKTSREEFDAKYGDSKKKSLERISQADLDILNEKISFFEDKCKWILDKKIKEINIIDSPTIRGLLKDPPRDLQSLNLTQIKKIEGAAIGKYRARIQILLYCLARYFFTEIKKIKKNIEELSVISFNDLKIINIKLFLLFEDYNKYFYQYFNIAKAELPSLLCGSNGENSHINSIHSLKNISTEIDNFKIVKIADRSTIVYEDGGARVDKKSSERAYGINTGIKRVGNESIDILHIDIYTEDGWNVTHLFDRSFFNNYVKGDYIKSISTIPIWNLLKEIENSDFKDIFSSFYKENHQDINYEKINKGLVDPIKLSSQDSTILIAETRSDAEHLKDIEKVIYLLISLLKKEYQEKFNYHFSLESIEETSRKSILKRFLEPKKCQI